eukprot:COSAG02_NODE_21766_length_775_cov_3.279586_1_plen_165_part_01
MKAAFRRIALVWTSRTPGALHLRALVWRSRTPAALCPTVPIWWRMHNSAKPWDACTSTSAAVCVRANPRKYLAKTLAMRGTAWPWDARLRQGFPGSVHNGPSAKGSQKRYFAPCLGALGGNSTTNQDSAATTAESFPANRLRGTARHQRRLGEVGYGERQASIPF